MKQGLVVIVVTVLISGLYVLRGCRKSEQPATEPTPPSPIVEDKTGNEATPEARMLAIKSEVEDLDKRGEYKIAYRLINDCLVHDYSLGNMQYAIEHAENHLAKLLSHNTTPQKSVFVTPKGKSTWDIIVDRFKIF